MKRLKKPEISIRVENNDGQTEEESSSFADDGKNESSARKDSNENTKTYEHERYYNSGSSNSETFSGYGNSSKNEVTSWYSESHPMSYYIEADGEDVDDEDDAMLKYEYESSRNAAAAAVASSSSNNSSPSAASANPLTPSATASVSVAAVTGMQITENAKPLDKSSVRRYCVQVAEHLFQCTLCYKTYTHISNFSRHFLSAHHGLRQEIPCPVCYRIFTRRDNMLTHMKQVHRITVTRGLATSIIQKLSAATENSSSAADSQTNSGD